MMGLLTAAPRHVVAGITKLTSLQAEAVFWVFWYGLMKGYSFSNLTWMCQQMILETGWGGSPLLVQNRNAFGMSCTNSPASTQVGCTQLNDGNTNGIYRTIQSSVKDRFMWDEKRFTEPYEHRKESTYPEVVAKRFYPDSPVVYRATVGSINVNPVWVALTVFGLFVPFEVLAIVKVIK